MQTLIFLYSFIQNFITMTKNIFVLAGIFSLFTTGILAQDAPKSSTKSGRFKPGVGLTITDWSKDGNGDVQGKAGWLLGASAQFGKKIYFEPGIFYVGKNTEITSINSSTQLPTTIEAKLNGIRVPVSVGLQLLGSAKSSFGLRAFGGASAFFLTGVGDGLDKDDYSKTNFGLHAGAGLDITIFYLDASYEWSLTNLQDNIGAIDFGKTRGFYLTAGIRF